MEFENKIIYIENQEGSEKYFNVREVFEKYIYYWKWFVLGLFISISVAYFYLKRTEKLYEVSTTIFIDDKNSGGLTTELSVFDDLGIIGRDASPSIINEIGVLKSRNLVEAVVKKLDINISYFFEGQFIDQEIYGNQVPFKINFFVHDSILYRLDTLFKIKMKSKLKYSLETTHNELIKEAYFGKNIKTEFGEINITPNNVNDIRINECTLVKITNLNSTISKYRSKIEIDLESKNSSLLILSLRDGVKKKAEDILDNLVIEYNNDAINYKNLITKRTDRFINDRIDDISVDLTDVDKGVEEFKSKNKLTDIEYEANLVLTAGSETRSTINDLASQAKLVDFVIAHLAENKDQLIPENLGIRDATSSENSAIYNRLLLERNRIIKTSSKLNPTVINLDEQIIALRQSIEQSLVNFKSSLIYSLNEAKNQEFRLNKKRNLAPQQEREFQNIRRKQQIIETLYLYLLQKREENAISLGIPVPNAKILDKAFGSNRAVSPKPMKIYLISVFVGLFIPLIIIAFFLLLDNKVHTHEDIESIVKAPIIGDIPKNSFKNKIITEDQGSSVNAEAFRLLRTNLNFMLSNDKEGAKKIFVTSTIGGEGKTYISINLANFLTIINKKVLLIGADLRKPKIKEYLNIKSDTGLSNYLSDFTLNISDILVSNEKHNFDFIISGDIPPNPSELLMNGRFEDILKFGSQNYDYIIVDTPPISIVTDTLLLNKYSDLFIYVIRANYLDKRLLKTVQQMYDKERLANMALLLNATDHKKYTYGYTYKY